MPRLSHGPRVPMQVLSSSRPRTRLALSLAAAATLAAGVSAELRLTKQDADRFQTKLVAITQYGLLPATNGKRRSIEVTDAELNSYLRYAAADQIPVGIVQPTITAVGNGRLAGRALVDLDAVRKQKKRGWTDPMAYLTGTLPVTAAGTLTTQNGIGRFQLESAEISGVTMPKALLQELLSYYSRTPEKPEGINMDDPFELPARIREIRVAQGSATIVQ
jgi:hypothetical protein